jgi:uncharacterized protein (UPF0261 family)
MPARRSPGLMSAGRSRFGQSPITGQHCRGRQKTAYDLWVGQVPERYKAREFFQYNAQNLLMRTNGEEFEKLGREFAARINAAKGSVRVLVPLEGFSEHSRRRAHDLQGNDKGPWKRLEEYRIFLDTLKLHVKSARVDELALHINDPAFADACVDAFVEIGKA